MILCYPRFDEGADPSAVLFVCQLIIRMAKAWPLPQGGLFTNHSPRLRRGIATLVNAVEKDAMAAKGLLRHASVTTTRKHYIKEVPEVTLKAMEKVETLCTNRIEPTVQVLARTTV